MYAAASVLASGKFTDFSLISRHLVRTYKCSRRKPGFDHSHRLGSCDKLKGNSIPNITCLILELHYPASTSAGTTATTYLLGISTAQNKVGLVIYFTSC